eukprot:COSAG02_NODE_20_length_53673_cov_86.864841_10_plen_86_part_00
MGVTHISRKLSSSTFHRCIIRILQNALGDRFTRRARHAEFRVLDPIEALASSTTVQGGKDKKSTFLPRTDYSGTRRLLILRPVSF